MYVRHKIGSSIDNFFIMFIKFDSLDCVTMLCKTKLRNNKIDLILVNIFIDHFENRRSVKKSTIFNKTNKKEDVMYNFCDIKIF